MVRPLQIQPVLNGYIIIVGCQQVVFNEPDEMLKEINRYLKNPDVVEKEYLACPRNGYRTGLHTAPDCPGPEVARPADPCCGQQVAEVCREQDRRR